MKRVALLLARLAIGIVFLVAGILKIRDPSGFATSISNYQLFPELSGYLAVVLPPIEILAGLGVIVLPALWRRASALAIAGMMLVFTAAASTALVRGIDVACACFGSESGPIDWLTIVRDLALLGAALFVVVADGAQRPENRGGRLATNAS